MNKMIKRRLGVISTVVLLPVCLFGTGESKSAVNSLDIKKANLTGIKVVDWNNQGGSLKGNRPLAGSADTWSMSWGNAVFPAKDADIEIQGTFNIVKPGRLYGFWFGAYYPMQYHYVVDQPGYDFGIVLRQENSRAYYRIQFSAKWDEIALWKEGEPGTDPDAPSQPTGFFAAVKPGAGIKLGQDYAFSARMIGNKIELLLNGKQVLAYEDKVLPLTKGNWGLGLTDKALVKLSGLEAKKAGGQIAIAAKPRPDFHLQNWHGEPVIFDGDEPILRLSGTWCQDVKFKPGYRAQVSWPFVFDCDHHGTTPGNINCTQNEVKFPYSGADEYIDGKGILTISYDQKRDTYVYDIDQTMTFKKDNDKYWYSGQRALYYADFFWYNSMPTTDESIKMSWDGLYTASSPYRMALLKWADGTTCRWPIHHSPWYSPWSKDEGFEVNWDLAKDTYFVLYPEPVVSPAIEIVSMGDDWKQFLNHCCCYWDMHFSFIPMKNGKRVDQLKAGDSYRERFRVLGYPRAEADKLKEKSRLAPFLNPDIKCPRYVPGSTDFCDSFAKGGNVEETAGREIWEMKNNVSWDTTTGRTDKCSLKFVNNASINDDAFGYNDVGLWANRWQLSLWVKADKWEGPGIRFGIKRLSAAPGMELSDYFPIKTGQWQKVSFNSSNPTRPNASLVYLQIETSGQGTCWVDDLEFKVLPVPEWEQVTSGEAERIEDGNKIVIDGQLQEPEWKTAVPTTGFIDSSTRQPAKLPTVVKLLYDDNYLYIGIIAREPVPEKLVAKCTRRDDPAYRNDDNIEILLDPGNTARDYYLLAVNPKGILYDAQCVSGTNNPAWNADCKVACAIQKDCWVMEMKLKASSLNAQIRECGKLKMNVVRNRKAGVAETSSWLPDGILNQPRYFRPVCLGGELFRNGGFESIQEVKVADPKTAGVTNTVLKPENWGIRAFGNLSVVSNDVHSGKYAVKLENGMLESADHAGVGLGDILHVVFWAKGNKMMDAGFSNFTPENDPMPAGSAGGTAVAPRPVQLTPEWKEYQFDARITEPRAGRVSLVFTTLNANDPVNTFTGTAFIDDVYVSKTEK